MVPHVINRDVICARGVLCIGPGSELLHGSSILDGYAKVQLDHVEEGYVSFDLPVPSDEHSKLADAIGSFIQWPKSRISISKVLLVQNYKLLSHCTNILPIFVTNGSC